MSIVVSATPTESAVNGEGAVAIFVDRLAARPSAASALGPNVELRVRGKPTLFEIGPATAAALERARSVLVAEFDRGRLVHETDVPLVAGDAR